NSLPSAWRCSDKLMSLIAAERWQSGRMRRFAKPLYGLKPVPRVRIPPSPPVLESIRAQFFSLPAHKLRRFRASTQSPSEADSSDTNELRISSRAEFLIRKTFSECA